ncbi:MAG: hypothetical protein DSZ29_06805 [Aquificaceae bacterium]|nr:MAG: hypothetical protein DSZ29_06805 [Aquificaceae bacterium]
MNNQGKLLISSYAKNNQRMAFKNIIIFLLGFSILLLSTTSFSSDKEKEKRWASQVIDSLMDGEAIFLNDGKTDFLALDMPAEKKSKIGVLVIHGIGIHPDWPQIVNPLRVGLSEAGWHTLSLQMPILKNSATGKDYLPLMKEVAPRIEAGISYLEKSGIKKIVLVAHSLGAQMTSYYLANLSKTKTPIIAYVAIGMGASNSELLKKITLPVFDIYGSEDLEGVMKSAVDRAKASLGNRFYKQQKIEGANHFFDDKNDQLIGIVRKYIKDFELNNFPTKRGALQSFCSRYDGLTPCVEYYISSNGAVTYPCN